MLGATTTDDIWKKALRWIPVVFCLFTILVVFRQLFVNPYIGLANNGDFARFVNKVGLSLPLDPAVNENNHDLYWRFMLPKFPINGLPEDTGFFTSAELLFAPALLLNNIFALDRGFFDVRWLGFVLFIVYTAFIILFFRYLKKTEYPMMIVSSVLSCLFLLDVYALGYFNAFYGEGTSYVFLIALSVCMLVSTQPGTIPFLRIVFIMTEGIAIYMFVCSKFQNILCLIPLLVVMTIQLLELNRSVTIKSISQKIALAALSLLIFGTSLFAPLYTARSHASKSKNLYSKSNKLAAIVH